MLISVPGVEYLLYVEMNETNMKRIH